MNLLRNYHFLSTTPYWFVVVHSSVFVFNLQFFKEINLQSYWKQIYKTRYHNHIIISKYEPLQLSPMITIRYWLDALIKLNDEHLLHCHLVNLELPEGALDAEDVGWQLGTPDPLLLVRLVALNKIKKSHRCVKFSPILVAWLPTLECCDRVREEAGYKNNFEKIQEWI